MTFVDIASRNLHIHKVHGSNPALGNKNIESSLLKITTPIGPNTTTNIGGPAGTRNIMLKSTDLTNNQIQLEQNSASFVGKQTKNDSPTSGLGGTKNGSPSGTSGANTSDAVYKCPKCPKTYNIAKSLRKHCRKNHNKLSICFCHHCPKVTYLLFFFYIKDGMTTLAKHSFAELKPRTERIFVKEKTLSLDRGTLQIFCLLMWRALPATYLHIACSLTAYLKYLQLAYGGAGNLQVFTATYM